MYPEELVRPMRSELTSNGFTELKSADDVTSAMDNAKGTTLVVVNSVCGCAAGTARPGVVHSLGGEKVQIIYLPYLLVKRKKQQTRQDLKWHHIHLHLHLLLCLRMVNWFIWLNDTILKDVLLK